MEVSVSSAANVSILAMSVIFTVLIILIFTIKTLVKLIPYQAPPVTPTRKIVTSTAGQDDQVAAITASWQHIWVKAQTNSGSSIYNPVR